jgi:hypothetical protein
MKFGGKETDVFSEEQVILQLSRGAETDSKETSKLIVRPPATPFGNVGRD